MRLVCAARRRRSQGSWPRPRPSLAPTQFISWAEKPCRVEGACSCDHAPASAMIVALQQSRHEAPPALCGPRYGIACQSVPLQFKQTCRTQCWWNAGRILTDCLPGRTRSAVDSILPQQCLSNWQYECYLNAKLRLLRRSCCPCSAHRSAHLTRRRVLFGHSRLRIRSGPQP